MTLGALIRMAGRRCLGSVVLVLFLLMQAMPLVAMWSGPSWRGIECCRRKGSAHACCKRQSKEPVMRPESACGGKSCCTGLTTPLSVRLAVELPPVRPLPAAVVVEPVEAPEPRTRPTPGYSPARFQRPPPLA
ncbi:MAG: hypothetical protein ACK6DY_21670 [Acidobacteriota bacterium]|nr:hypothetical protein [Acidobacteriaceae bacterium]